MATLKKQNTKRFKVAAVSSNQNSFGLTGVILLAADGEAWQVGATQLSMRPVGSILPVSVTGKTGRQFARLGFEIPERLDDAPPAVIAEVWG